MRTIVVSIPVGEDLQEFLIAELSDLDFEAFEQEDDGLRAYIDAARWNDVAREWIEQWLIAQGIEARISEAAIEPANWNAAWEETIRPVAVPPFLIKPTWADVPEAHRDKILVEVDPKMSFGTGYHETTRLMLRLLPSVVFPGARLIDAGTGTGILAIAAVKLGAKYVLAFDIDEWSFTNAKENALLNGVDAQVDIRLGGIDQVPTEPFDAIIANINLNVLLGLLPEFHTMLDAGGWLLMSGMLRTDRDRMIEALKRGGFDASVEEVEGEWWAVTAVAR